MAGPKFNIPRAQQAMGGGALDFRPQDRLDISDLAHVTITFDFDASEGYTQILLELDSDCQYRWDDSSTDTVSSNNDLTLLADTIYQITVPLKLANRVGADIYLHLQQTSTASTKYARYVKI